MKYLNVLMVGAWLLCATIAPLSVKAAVTFDATCENGSNSTADPIDFNCSVGAGARGLLCTVSAASDGSDQVDTITAGGVGMTEIAGSPLIGTGGEPAALQAYFLGSSVPTGTVAISVDVNATTGAKRVVCASVNASANTEVVDTSIIDSNSSVNPSFTVSLSSKTSWVGMVLGSGHSTAADIAPSSGWTGVLEPDFGSRMGGFYIYDTIGTADVACAWTQLAEDAYAICVAVSEVVGGASGLLLRRRQN